MVADGSLVVLRLCLQWRGLTAGGPARAVGTAVSRVRSTLPGRAHERKERAWPSRTGTRARDPADLARPRGARDPQGPPEWALHDRGGAFDCARAGAGRLPDVALRVERGRGTGRTQAVESHDVQGLRMRARPRRR